MIIKFTEDYDVNDNLEDLLDYIEQKYDSSVTSINSSKLPAIFSMITLAPGTVNLDFGGGKYDNVAEYLKPLDVLNVVYDPFNRSKEHNKEVLDVVKQNGGADTITCSNVLNVIEEPENRLDVIKKCYRCLKPGGIAYFTVYEGSGSGEGKANDKRASYQTNMKTSDYVDDIASVFPNVTRKGKLIIAK